MKCCIKCNQQKPLSEFYRRDDRSSGYTAECKVCRRARVNAARHRKACGFDAEVEKLWNPPDAEYLVRECLCCRNPFQTANDYRMCPKCRGTVDQKLAQFEAA